MLLLKVYAKLRAFKSFVDYIITSGALQIFIYIQAASLVSFLLGVSSQNNSAINYLLDLPFQRTS